METPRYTRRLSDKILWAFDHALDVEQVDIAGVLMQALELSLTLEGDIGFSDKRRDFEQVVQAFEKLKRSRKFA
jgi:uncharacterized protein involved in type VI secretion and phage assembly